MRARLGSVITLATVALVSSFSPIAMAEAEAEAPSLEDPSYKTEILIAHAAPLGLMWGTAIVADGKRDGAYFTAFGLTLPPLILAPPVVHAAHGNWGRSAASFGLNFVAAFPGWATMWASVLDPCDEMGTRCDDDKFKKAAAVHTVFNGLVTLADIYLADISPEPKPREAATIVQPGISPTSGGLMLGVGGVF